MEVQRLPAPKVSLLPWVARSTMGVQSSPRRSSETTKSMSRTHPYASAAIVGAVVVGAGAATVGIVAMEGLISTGL